MNWHRIEGRRKQLKGSVKAQWGKVTDEERDVIAGKRENFAGRIRESIQDTYGASKDEAERHRGVTG